MGISTSFVIKRWKSKTISFIHSFFNLWWNVSIVAKLLIWITIRYKTNNALNTRQWNVISALSWCYLAKPIKWIQTKVWCSMINVLNVVGVAKKSKGLLPKLMVGNTIQNVYLRSQLELAKSARNRYIKARNTLRTHKHQRSTILIALHL